MGDKFGCSLVAAGCRWTKDEGRAGVWELFESIDFAELEWDIPWS